MRRKSLFWFPMGRRCHLRVQAAFLVFVLSAGILLPEVGHSLAHLNASAAAEHHDAPHHHGDHHSVELSDAASLIGEDKQATHPHLNLLTTIPGPATLKSLVAATPSIQNLQLDSISVSRVFNLPPETAQPFVSEHGPPPPSRAPPLT